MKEHKGEIEVTFGKLHVLDFSKVMRLIQESGGKVRPSPSKPNMIIITVGAGDRKEKSAFLRDKLMQLV